MWKQRISSFWTILRFNPTPCFAAKIFHRHPYYQIRGNESPFCHQVVVCPNWSLRSLSKLPFLLDAHWSIINFPDHSPILKWIGIWSRNCTISSDVIFDCSQWWMHFLFLLYFLVFVCFYNQFDWYDIFSSTVRLQIIFNCYEDDIQLFAKITGKLHIVIWPNQRLKLREGYISFEAGTFLYIRCYRRM